MRKKSLLLILLILTLIGAVLLPWQTVRADTHTVTNTDDSGPGSLRQAITDANNHPGPDTITFAAATNGKPIILAGPAAEDTNAGGDLDILNGGDLTIQGNGTANTIIDGGGIDRVFHVCPAGGCTNTVTINAVIIRNGSADFGGGILNQGATLNVQDSVIGGIGVGNSASDDGGGIDNQAGTTTLDGTTVSANRAENGGGICNHATLNVQDGSTIGGVGASNQASNGGGIHNFTGTTTLVASTVISNTASGDGGGIHNYAGSTSVEGSTVISNTASDDGGGIYIQDGITTVEGSTVNANIAGDDGGGIYNHANLEVQDSIIGSAGASNRANYGGGIHNFAGQTTVDGSTISSNQATDGGGIYNHFAATLNVLNGSTIGEVGAGNTATSYGGGIYNGNGGITTVDASSIHANTATVGGGGIFNGTDGTTMVDESTIISNTSMSAGGGIFNWSGTTKLQSTTIISNTAVAAGGGINNYYGTTTVDGCTVSTNTAPSGGGIYNHATLNVTNSTIGGIGAGNTAYAGGGIHNWFGTATLDSSTVSANLANRGGGIYNDAVSTITTSAINLAPATLSIQNTTIGGVGVGNTAITAGGGIYNGYEFTLQVVGSRILYNTAPEGGGVFSWNELVGATSVTGGCIVGNSHFSFFNDKTAGQIATGNWWGAVGGPGAPGADTVGGGLVDTSDFLNTPILGCAPDLLVDKTNNTGGVALSGTPFNWTLTVANPGLMDAVFYAGDRILDDDLPAGPTYLEPLVSNLVDVTNSANITCSITGGTLTCQATGANVTIAAATGRFEVIIPVTPNASGILTNPAGNCRVDPDGEVTESDESNNNCPANVVNVTSIKTYLPLVIR